MILYCKCCYNTPVLSEISFRQLTMFQILMEAEDFDSPISLFQLENGIGTDVPLICH